jgi:geranylgeranyl diphosphate synthase type I
MARPPNALQTYAALAEPRLAAFLDEKVAMLSRLPVDLAHAAALLRDYVLRGGKRLRGALVLLGHEAAGGRPEDALSPSLGCELLHAYLLIHDDFMDRDELRRGGPTLHTSLAKRHGEHLGGSLALLLGSLCQAWAHELVLASPASADRVRAALGAFERAIEEVTVGQCLDLAAAGAGEVPAAAVLEIERRKTGGYTFELPLRLGALLGGASPALIAQLERYARPLGQAFQIADDLLGTFGAPEVTGKPNASDLREGKRTLLIVRALEAATPADAAALRAGLGRADLTDAQADELRAVLRRTGAPEAARADADRLCSEAIAALEGGSIPVSVSGQLAELAAYAVKRAS